MPPKRLLYLSTLLDTPSYRAKAVMILGLADKDIHYITVSSR